MNIPKEITVPNPFDDFFHKLCSRKGLTYRQQQSDLAYDIYQTIKNCGVSVLESPTGTGKTLAYLTAAYHYCREVKDGQVVIATTTKALQKQLVNEFGKYFDRSGLKIVIMKGKMNYLCRPALVQLVNEFKERGNKEKYEAASALLRDADRPDVLGDMELLDEQVVERFEDVIGPIEHYGIVHDETDRDALYYVHRVAELARDADIVVTNHPLFIVWAYFKVDRDSHSYLVSRLGNQARRFMKALEGLPFKFDNVIVDEAHEIERKMKDMLSYSVPVMSIIHLAYRAMEILQHHKLHRRLDTIKQDLKQLEKQKDVVMHRADDYYSDIIPINTNSKDPFSLEVVKLMSLTSKLLSSLKKIVPVTKNMGYKLGYWVDLYAEHCSKALEIIHSPEDNPRGVGFYAKVWKGKRGVSVIAYPAYVGGSINYMTSHFLSATFISGTLANSAGDVSHFITKSGIRKLIEKKRYVHKVYKPIAMKDKVTLHMFDNTPHPTSDDNGDNDNFKEVYEKKFVPAVLDIVLRAIKDEKKRTLILCNSHWETMLWKRLLEENLQDKEILHYAGRTSGEVTLNNVLSKFEKGHGVLVTASAWVGVDTNIGTLIIPRVPFSLVDDPIYLAQEAYFKSKYGPKEASRYMSSIRSYDAFVKLRQGVGRLFRNESSRGNIYVLDRRAKMWVNYFKQMFNVVEHK